MRTRQGRLPDFVVVGSMKCGTTSLHHYLSRHPQIAVSWPKELRFFIGAETRRECDESGGNWWRGEGWYRRHFSVRKPVCGEVSPSYVGARWGTAAAERMKRMLPDALLILLVREPMARLRSHYLMRRQNADVGAMTFTEYVVHPDFATDVAYSDYGSQISRLFEFFPRQSLMVVESADLDSRRQQALGKIFAFLGVDPKVCSPGFRRRFLDGSRRRVPSPFGARILQSPLVRVSERILPFTLHEGVRDLLVRPFSIPRPDLSLPKEIDEALRARFHREAALARSLTGLPLSSLDPAAALTGHVLRTSRMPEG